MAKKKQFGWGGYREGAGSKPILTEPIRCSVNLEAATVSRLSTLADQAGVSFAVYVRGTLEKHVAARGRRRRN